MTAAEKQCTCNVSPPYVSALRTYHALFTRPIIELQSHDAEDESTSHRTHDTKVVTKMWHFVHFNERKVGKGSTNAYY